MLDIDQTTRPSSGQPDAQDQAPEPARLACAFEELVREIGEDGACEVRAVFWSDTDARLALLRRLELSHHRARIEREAHSLKSAARTLGYLRLAALALHLEQRAATLEPAAHDALLAAMDAAYAAARAQEPRS
jgi:HPt (histidine-containing phosphotransfer) domain-containing protein